MRPSLCCTILVLVLCLPSLADDRKKAIADAFDKLADRDATIRMQAKQDLMNLDAPELDLLRQVVSDRVQLKPAQFDPLREIVLYVRVRTAVAKLPKVARGFLGVSLPPPSEEQFMKPEGAHIISRLRGFVAYRLLEDGDIITAIGPDDAMTPVRSSFELRMSIGKLAPGNVVNIRVLRGTRELTLRIPLDAALASENTDRDPPLDLSDAEREAAAYWDQHFAPLVPADAP